MKLLVTTLLCTGLSASALAGESIELKTEQDKINYAVGHQIGGDFKQHNVNLNDPALIQGVKDALSGGKAQLSDEEMQKTLVDFKNKIEAHQHEQMHHAITSTAQGDLTKARAFMAENAKKPGVVVLPSGLQYKVLQTGKGKMEGSPKDDSKVTVTYQASLIDGRVFATSHKNGKSTSETYTLSDLVPGVQEGLKKMEEGDKWQLFVPSELGVPRGKGPMELRASIYEIELIEFK